MQFAQVTCRGCHELMSSPGDWQHSASWHWGLREFLLGLKVLVESLQWKPTFGGHERLAKTWIKSPCSWLWVEAKTVQWRPEPSWEGMVVLSFDLPSDGGGGKSKKSPWNIYDLKEIGNFQISLWIMQIRYNIALLFTELNPICFNFYFILEYSWFTMLCSFQVYSSVSVIRISILFQILFSWGYYGILSGVPRAIQQVLVDCLFYI